MNTYTVSFYGRKIKEEGWRKYVQTIESQHQPTYDEFIEIINGIAEREELRLNIQQAQLEQGNPALPYVPPDCRKRKNTNAWKPRRYCK